MRLKYNGKLSHLSFSLHIKHLRRLIYFSEHRFIATWLLEGLINTNPYISFLGRPIEKDRFKKYTAINCLVLLFVCVNTIINGSHSM